MQSANSSGVARQLLFCQLAVVMAVWDSETTWLRDLQPPFSFSFVSYIVIMLVAQHQGNAEGAVHGVVCIPPLLFSFHLVLLFTAVRSQPTGAEALGCDASGQKSCPDQHGRLDGHGLLSETQRRGFARDG